MTSRLQFGRLYVRRSVGQSVSRSARLFVFFLLCFFFFFFRFACRSRPVHYAAAPLWSAAPLCGKCVREFTAGIPLPVWTQLGELEAELTKMCKQTGRGDERIFPYRRCFPPSRSAPDGLLVLCCVGVAGGLFLCFFCHCCHVLTVSPFVTCSF